MTFGSLFSGVGGMDLGLERAGMTCAWQVEIDDYCQRVLAKHWPSVPKHRDVREVGGHNLEPVDLICGGFPCQDISNAGKRAGIEGERSGLWSEYARIIRELRPRYVLVENVAALLARGLGRVLGDLAESGYDAEWDCIPAAAVGAPHRRDRLFLVGYANGADRACASVAGVDGETSDVADAYPAEWRPLAAQGDVANGRHARREEAPGGLGACGADLADAPGARQSLFERSSAHAELRGFRATCGAGWWGIEPDVGRVADGVPARVDRLRGLGNAVVPQVAEFIGRRILEVSA